MTRLAVPVPVEAFFKLTRPARGRPSQLLISACGRVSPGRACSYGHQRSVRRRDLVSQMALVSSDSIGWTTHWMGDTSPAGLTRSIGFTVNYVYRLTDVEPNHEAYARRMASSLWPQGPRHGTFPAFRQSPGRTGGGGSSGGTGACPYARVGTTSAARTAPRPRAALRRAIHPSPFRGHPCEHGLNKGLPPYAQYWQPVRSISSCAQRRVTHSISRAYRSTWRCTSQKC